MDENFNFADAKSIIDSFMAKHGQTDLLPAGSMYVTDDVEASSKPAGAMSVPCTDYQLQSISPRVKPEENSSSTAYRLFVDDESSDEEKELTLYTVGVLVQKLLPPFKPKRKYTQGRQTVFGSFRQSVTLHGADALPMASTLKAVKYAYVVLDRHAARSAPFPAERVRADNLVVWNPYFTVGEDAKTKDSVPFTKLVDPFDDLNRAVTEDCVHASDNEVQYIQGYEDEHGVFRHAAVTPSHFRALAMKELDEVSKISKKRTSISRGLLVEDQEDRPVGKVRRALAKLDIEGGAMDVEDNAGPSGESASGSNGNAAA
ncbi:hypothetical protein K525DRAFT_273416 [Schizophyllum commune Loenen D]|nr:hypothetical protein K525DRAFT_273416 [Schizophyllum commune Loenen D]